jgi:hypothetical protein
MIGDGDCAEIGGMKIGRGNQVLGENLPQRHFVHQKSRMTRPGFEPGGKPATNRLSYGAEAPFFLPNLDTERFVPYSFRYITHRTIRPFILHKLQLHKAMPILESLYPAVFKLWDDYSRP